MCTIKSIICHNLPYYQKMLIGLEKEGITIYFGNGKLSVNWHVLHTKVRW